MRPTPRLPRTLMFAALVPALMASKCKKDKDKEVETPPWRSLLRRSRTGGEHRPGPHLVGESTPAIIYGRPSRMAPASGWMHPRSRRSRSGTRTASLSVCRPSPLAHMTSGSSTPTAPQRRSARRRRPPEGRRRPDRGPLVRQDPVDFEFDRWPSRPNPPPPCSSTCPAHDAEGTIRVEGHCDERGTTDYNLALGQRRADAVQRWLTSNGVSPARIRAVSLGEERPSTPAAPRTPGPATAARNSSPPADVSTPDESNPENHAPLPAPAPRPWSDDRLCAGPHRSVRHRVTAARSPSRCSRRQHREAVRHHRQSGRADRGEPHPR